ncbi:MAG: hypothetical protein HDR71_16960 [Lachnospiraceae bacterium]|nr:hypothetical protein [Lachnospiraceae bacterium]
MAKKINTNANHIIDRIINRIQDLIGADVFDKLFLYEQELQRERPKHLFSVEDCKTVLKKEYIMKFPFNGRDSIIETESECLLLLYNWQKSKVIYNINIERNNSIHNEYINPKIFNQFPYPGFYVDYNFKNTEYYGAFVTYYKHAEEIHLQKRLLLGFVMYDGNHDIWSIEPVFFDIKNNVSVIDSLVNTMDYELGFNNKNAPYLKELSNLSCIVVKFLSSIIEYYDLEPKIKHPHTYKKFSKQNNEYDVRLEINNTIKLNKDRIVYQKRNYNNTNKSSPKSPHPRRAHTREIAVKNEAGEIVGYRTIWISSSYIHKDDDKPINLKNIEE